MLLDPENFETNIGMKAWTLELFLLLELVACLRIFFKMNNAIGFTKVPSATKYVPFTFSSSM